VGTEENPAPTVALAELTDDYTDSGGNQVIYKTDRYGKVIERTDALGNLTKTDRDREGNARKAVRANGAETSMKYDERDNLVYLKDAEGSVTEYEYDATFNQITVITDAKGNTTTTDYDANGNPVKITDAMSNETIMVYNSKGLLTSTTDALDNTTIYTYDAAGNLVTITDPLENTTTMGYDAAGNLISSEDAEGRVTQYEYDNMNRLAKVIGADSNETNYSYDSAGNLVSVTDANGNATSYEYNEQNNLSSVINEAGQRETYAYDAQKNLSAITDRNGNVITHVYCPLNNLIKKFFPDGEIVEYSYDEVCNLSRVKDADSEVSMLYDLNGRIISSSTAGSILQPGVTIGCSYDVNGNKVTMTDTTGTTDYGYDELNRLLSLANPNVQTTTFGYDELSRRTSMALANGIITSYDYDSASQLTSIQSSAVSYQYAYNKVGNRTSMTELAGVNNYAYDVLNRLTGVIHPQPSNSQEDFSYDNVGNRLTSHISPSYIYDNLNRLAEDNEYTYIYDHNGHTTCLTVNPAYNAENQLTRIDFADGTYTAYAYDGLGRRIQKDVNGTINRYVYDGENILLEYDGTNTLIARYTHGLGTDEPIIMDRNSQSYFCHVDALGSITALTDNSGNIVQTYLYDSFGQIVEQTGTIQQPYSYTGREFDVESDLYYYRARYYNAKAGRFAIVDPILFPMLSYNSFVWHLPSLVSSPQSLHSYVYVKNNPVNFVDPTGLKWWSVWGRGSKLSGIIESGYGLSQCGACLVRAKAYINKAAVKLDLCKYKEWEKAAMPGAECAGICGTAAEAILRSVAGSI
jgi:RHS repeat-associated protein